jgi:hypothetical protein
VKRTLARLLDLAVAIALLLALASAAQLHAAEWPNIRQSDTLWPLAPLGDPQWPNIPADSMAQAPRTVPARVDAGSDSAKAPAGYGLGDVAGVATAIDPPKAKKDDDLVTGASLDVPVLKAPPPPPPAFFDKRFPSPFVFEAGARYWYSVGQNRFAFANKTDLFAPGIPLGNPTSTLDWDRMQGHSGEIFARVDHLPTGLFAKGLIGGGVIKGGDVDDLDFVIDQINFSNTTSAVNGNNLTYAMFDLGYSFNVPEAGIRYGAFVGYHYWREKMGASGLLCNAVSPLVIGGCPAGALIIPYSTQVFTWETTWHALRVGAEVRVQVWDRVSISAEAAWVPYAWLRNDDSHLLRQDPSDLGPAPNIIDRGARGMGGEVEAFINYQVMPHFQVGVGARYWSIYTQSGTSTPGPAFSQDFPLTKFSTQRYGVLLEAKATF